MTEFIKDHLHASSADSAEEHIRKELFCPECRLEYLGKHAQVFGAMVPVLLEMMTMEQKTRVMAALDYAPFNPADFDAEGERIEQ